MKKSNNLNYQFYLPLLFLTITLWEFSSCTAAKNQTSPAISSNRVENQQHQCAISKPSPCNSASDTQSLGAPKQTCFNSSECSSGICEGQGCGLNAGRCAPKRRGCKRNRKPYCDCDNHTFYASGNCPRRRYLHRGPCQSDKSEE